MRSSHPGKFVYNYELGSRVYDVARSNYFNRSKMAVDLLLNN